MQEGLGKPALFLTLCLTEHVDETAALFSYRDDMTVTVVFFGDKPVR